MHLWHLNEMSNKSELLLQLIAIKKNAADAERKMRNAEKYPIFSHARYCVAGDCVKKLKKKNREKKMEVYAHHSGA